MNWTKPKVYAAKHKKENVISESRSGGIFTALTDKILDQQGIVYGCILDESFHAVHVRADQKSLRDLMRGSKYIQSILGDTYKNVKEDLKKGNKVLFSGTSCQIAGLKKFLEKDYENLICIDIVCHGVPSPMIWEAYIKWQEEKEKSIVEKVDFRNKKTFGWKDHVETLTFTNGKTVNSKVFTTLFYGHNILRPSCYACPYKSVMHPGDITIADYWGIEKAAPEFDDNKGVSLILVNNEKGEKLFDSIKEDIIWKATRLEDSMQPPLKESFPRPKERNQFWHDVACMEFEKVAKKYGNYGMKNKIKNKIKNILRMMKNKILR